jgi:putative ABC transport system permease protein
MNIFGLFNLSITALKSNILRTLLTMLGIIIGISSVIIIISIGQGASKSITNEVSSFGSNWFEFSPVAVNAKSMQGPPVSTLTLQDAEALATTKSLGNIDKVSGYNTKSLTVSANGQDNKYTVLGISKNMFGILNFKIDSGDFFTDEDEGVLAKVAVIGPDASKELFGENTNPVGKTIKIDSKNFRVVGLIESKGSSGFGGNYDKSVFIPLKTGMKLVFGDTKLQAIFATVKDTKIIETTMNDAGNLILARHKIDNIKDADFSIQNSKDALSILNTITGLLTAMLAGIAGISLVVGGIGIMNIMLVTVTERTREVGLLKAIGAKKKDILKQFLIEAVLLTVLGGIVGIIIGGLLSYWASKLIDIPFVLTPYSIFLAVSVSSVVGIIFGLYPANRAAKLNPIDALRFE